MENEGGERIGGSCFTLEGETEAETLTDVCDQGDDGRLNFPDLPSGEYTIIQTRAGGNRQLAPEQSVTVEPGQTVESPYSTRESRRPRRRRRRRNRVSLNGHSGTGGDSDTGVDSRASGDRRAAG